MMSKVSVGGYHNRFVKQDQIMDMLICKICHAVSRHPYETQCCKNTFCKSCIERSSKWNNNCPICRSFLQITMAVQIDRSIKCLNVYCEYERNGCRWIGQVEGIKKHMKECLFYPVPCEYQIIGCKKLVPRSLQVDHNWRYMKMHFNLVLGCVKELNDTKRQLQHAKDELIESNDLLCYYQRNYDDVEECEEKLNNANEDLKECEEKLKKANRALFYVEQDLYETKTKKARKMMWLTFFLIISLLCNLGAFFHDSSNA